MYPLVPTWVSGVHVQVQVCLEYSKTESFICELLFIHFDFFRSLYFCWFFSIWLKKVQTLPWLLVMNHFAVRDRHRNDNTYRFAGRPGPRSIMRWWTLVLLLSTAITGVSTYFVDNHVFHEQTKHIETVIYLQVLPFSDNNASTYFLHWADCPLLHKVSPYTAGLLCPIHKLVFTVIS